MMQIADNKKNLLTYGLVTVAFLWFAAAMLHYVSHQPPGYDDAYNASVAKNFVNGLGWSSNYHRTIPFNSTVTTGPTLLLPTALAIKLFGPELWLPGVVNALCMLAVLALCGILLRRLVPDNNQYLLLALSGLLLLSTYDHNIWVVLIGEGALALLVLAATLLGVRSLTNAHTYHFIATGMLLGLAFLAKLYALITIAGIITFFLWYLIVEGGNRRATLAGQLLVAVIGFLIVVAPWTIYERLVLAELPATEIDSRNAFGHRFFLYYGSGLGQLLGAPEKFIFLIKNSVRNFNGLAEYIAPGELGIAAAALIPLAAIAGMLWTLTRKTPTRVDLLIGLIASAAAAHWAWFFAIKFGPWVHYSRIPMMLSCLLIPLLAMRLAGSRGLMALIAMFLVVLPADKRSSWLDLLRFGSVEHPVLTAQRQMIELAGRQQPGDDLAGCDWMVFRQLDYALPNGYRLKDCLLLLQEQLDKDGFSPQQGTAADNAPVIQLGAPVRFKLITGGYLEFLKPKFPLVVEIESYCTQDPQQVPGYLLLDCRVETLPYSLAKRIHLYAPVHLAGVDPRSPSAADD